MFFLIGLASVREWNTFFCLNLSFLRERGLSCFPSLSPFGWIPKLFEHGWDVGASQRLVQTPKIVWNLFKQPVWLIGLSNFPFKSDLKEGFRERTHNNKSSFKFQTQVTFISDKQLCFLLYVIYNCSKIH